VSLRETGHAVVGHVRFGLRSLVAVAPFVLVCTAVATAVAAACAALMGAPVLVMSVLIGGLAAGGSSALAGSTSTTDGVKRLTVVWRPTRHVERQKWGRRQWLAAGILLGITVGALLVRFWHFNDIGYNSDEAVYAGQAAGIAHDPQLAPYFPVFRAHPLLFQSVVAIGYEYHLGDWFGRAAAIGFGALCVLVTFELGRLLYGVRAGLIGAALLALMPYHVIVSRQLLLDGPQAFFTTVTLCLLIRFARTGRTLWLCCAAAGMGLSILAKEPSVIFCGAVYAFFALSPDVRVRVRAALISLAVMAITVVPYPLALALSGQTRTGGNFLAWQLVRRPNHSLLFYLTTVPGAIGLAVCACAVLSLVACARGRRWSWRETLVACWIGVPVAFLELWPVKGFQYLLPLAPVVAVLAANGVGVLAGAIPQRRWVTRTRVQLVLAGALLVTLAVPTYAAVTRSTNSQSLAGSGGIPGGRATGRYVAAHVPEGATLLTIGPSMANIIEFYGHRRAYGLSVSSNPLRRNPIYASVTNPDRLLRRGDVQYIVWDAYSARRSTHFERRLLSYVSRYRGTAIYTFSTTTRSARGTVVRVPVIIVYSVRPA
jgi:hypothetical protein